MKTTKKLVLGGLLIALNIVLPYLFHTLPEAGKIFLPMHIGVLIAGLLLGPGYGIIIGAVAPVLSMLVSGMPAMPNMIFMTAELATYGLSAGLFGWLFRKVYINETVGVYCSLFLAMMVGRAVYAGVLLLLGFVGVDQAPAVVTVLAALLRGLPGVAIQVIFVPVVVAGIKRIFRLEKPKEKPIRY